MDFMEMYAQKKMTPEQAASLVKSGDWNDKIEGVFKAAIEEFKKTGSW